MNWSNDNSGECIKLLNNIKAKSIYSYDFSTLYTNLPLQNVYDNLEKFIIKFFKKSNCNYIAVNLYNGISFFTSKIYKSYKMYTLSKLLDSIKFILFNTYITFGNKIFHQTKGIPMGGNSSPIISDLYLCSLEFDYMNKLIKTDYNRARLLSNNCRYLDDIVTPNINDFIVDFKIIYPTNLILEANVVDNTNDNISDHFLDLDIYISENRFCFKVYNKVDAFHFRVISFPFAKSCIPINIGYNTFYSQLFRYSKICSALDNFKLRVKKLIDNFIEHKYTISLLKKYFSKFCVIHHDNLLKYNIPNYINFVYNSFL